MTKSTFVAAAAMALGCLMAILDLLSGPSLNLLAVDSTVLSALTIVSVALIATHGMATAGGEAREGFDGTRGTPMSEMVRLLKGARNGYTLNRKEIALVLRSATASKMGDSPDPPSRESVDAYLRTALGTQRFSEFVSWEEWRTTRVEASESYIAHLRDTIISLKESLGF